MSCSENADCVTNRAGQGQCVCRRGYRGDGDNCFIIPSDVSIRGYADPQQTSLNKLSPHIKMKTLSDLQPQVVHFYEVSNFGPFDVGNIIVNISWPLQTDEGDWLLYLTDVPYFKVFYFSRICTIFDSLNDL